jgi:hypothetical protein
MAPRKKNQPRASKKKNEPPSLPSLLKNKSNKGVSALVVQHSSEDWQMKVAARFMGVRNKEEEPVDPHAIQQQLQQANLKLADAWKVMEDASNACTTLADLLDAPVLKNS